VWVLVDRAGAVAHAGVHRSSGDPRFDAYAEELGTRLRFEPASVDGVGRDVWVQIPMGVRTTPPNPGTRNGRRGP
jgi:TonB family protein